MPITMFGCQLRTSNRRKSNSEKQTLYMCAIVPCNFVIPFRTSTATCGLCRVLGHSRWLAMKKTSCSIKVPWHISHETRSKGKKTHSLDHTYCFMESCIDCFTGLVDKNTQVRLCVEFHQRWFPLWTLHYSDSCSKQRFKNMVLRIRKQAIEYDICRVESMFLLMNDSCRRKNGIVLTRRKMRTHNIDYI